MISKMFRIALTMVLASFALASTAWACSNSSVTGVYGFVGGGTNTSGLPTASLDQVTFDSSTGTFTGTATNSTDGVIETSSISGTYAVATNCTVTGTYTIGSETQPFSAVVTSTGGVKEVNGTPGATNGGLALAQDSPTCTNAGVAGGYGFAEAGVFVTGAPFTGPVALIGELELSVNGSGDGVINGRVAGSENGTILAFTPVTGSYSITASCTGTATITPKGESALNYSLVVVNGGKAMQAIETDADTVVTGTLQR